MLRQVAVVSKPSVLVVVNPHASRAEAALREVERFAEEQPSCLVVKSRSQEHLSATLREHGPGKDRIIIGGGDGTISCALPALLELGKPLAVLPLGTANDFARTIGVALDLQEATRTAFEGVEQAIDVGIVNGRPFLNVASIGIPVSVAEAQSRSLKRRLKIFSYGASLRQVAQSAKPFTAEVWIDDRPPSIGLAYQVSVGNGRFHGGGLSVSDHAAIDDGLLDAYIVRPGRFWQLFAALAYLRFGVGGNPEVLERHSATKVVLRTRKPRPINIDGEICLETPAEFGIRRQALTVLVPRILPPGHQGLSRTGSEAGLSAAEL